MDELHLVSLDIHVRVRRVTSDYSCYWNEWVFDDIVIPDTIQFQRDASVIIKRKTRTNITGIPWMKHPVSEYWQYCYRILNQNRERAAKRT